MAILAGDFLLARASVSLAALRDSDVIQLLSQVIEDLVSGEIMQVNGMNFRTVPRLKLNVTATAINCRLGKPSTLLDWTLIIIGNCEVTRHSKSA